MKEEKTLIHPHIIQIFEFIILVVSNIQLQYSKVPKHLKSKLTQEPDTHNGHTNSIFIPMST